MTTSPVSVPLVTIGPATVPRVFLGDHGYLAKLDSVMSVTAVTESMSAMVSMASVGISAGETRVVDAALSAQRSHDPHPPLMIHGDLAVTAAGEKIRYRQCAVMTARSLASRGIDLRADPVLGFLYTVSAGVTPLERFAAAGLTLDAAALESLASDIRRARPAILTVGGDWVDMLLLLGRPDLIIDGLNCLRAVTAPLGSALVLTTYVGAVVDARLMADITNLVDGLMTPINDSGAAMLPHPEALWNWIMGAGLPIIGMHVLAGAPEPQAGLHWLWTPPVAAVVVGASSSAHQAALAAALAAAFPGSAR